MSATTVELATALAHFGDDVGLLSQLAGIFVEETPLRLEALREGLRVNDASAVRAAAHALKGVLLALGASEPAARAEEIERHARDGELDRVRALVPAVGRNVDEIVGTVSTWPALLRATADTHDACHGSRAAQL